MADLSTQNPCGLAQRVATALLRATGGTTACLQMSPLAGDSADTGQIGLDAPGFLSLPLSPAVFRKAPRHPAGWQAPEVRAALSRRRRRRPGCAAEAQLRPGPLCPGHRRRRLRQALPHRGRFILRKPGIGLSVSDCCYRKPPASGPCNRTRHSLSEHSRNRRRLRDPGSCTGTGCRLPATGYKGFLCRMQKTPSI